MKIGRQVAAAFIAVIAISAGEAWTAPKRSTDWAFPPLSPHPGESSEATVERLDGSARRFTTAQVHDMTHAVDWFGEAGPSAPASVTRGDGRGGPACGFCHLPTGQGRPENATLAGLPADYIVEQVAAMRSGDRRGARPDWPPTALMHAVAGATTPADVRAAAAWFSAQRFIPRTRVVETSVVPGTAAEAFVRRFDRSAPPEPLGMRIVEGPEDFGRFELRDDRVGYIAYVPPGSISHGARLAATGDGGRTQPCGSCHGAGLKGDIGPPLAGRSPTGIFRQLYSFKVGGRQSPQAAPMRVVVAHLTTSDMIAVAAYAGSLKP
jgi:cytochrome c553